MKSYAAIFLIMLMLWSCKRARWQDNIADFKELQNPAFALQVMKMKNKDTDTVSLNLRVRLYPSAGETERLSPDQKNGLSYGMDSCFFLFEGAQRIKPAFVQAVSNGVRNSFEYLVSFEPVRPVSPVNFRLVYQGKYLDGKQYNLTLNK